MADRTAAGQPADPRLESPPALDEARMKPRRRPAAQPRQDDTVSILVTGGTGFVGAATVAHLAAAGREAVVLAAHPQEGGWLPKGVPVRIGDVCDADGLAALMRGHCVSAVIHLAAITAGPDMEREAPERVVAVNAGGTAAVLRAAAACGIGRVVVSSSASVYPPGKADEERFRADRDPPAPAALYGLTKLMGEQIARRLGQVYGLSTPILRISGVYGPYERATGVREILSAQAQVMEEARAGRETRLSRPCRGAWLYSRDAAAGLAALLDGTFTEPAPVFDLGGPEVFSVADFCAAIAPAFPGWRHRIDPADPTVRFQLPADRPGSDFARLKAATGFTPRFGLKEAVPDYLAWREAVA